MPRILFHPRAMLSAAVLIVGLLASACSGETTDPSPLRGSSDNGSSLVQSDSLQASFGWHGGP